jgi:hypothetical protein
MQGKINLNRIVKYYYFSLEKKGLRDKLRSLFISLVKYFLYGYDLKVKSRTKFLFFNSTNRNDHNNLFNVIFEQCHYDKSQLVINNKVDIKFGNIARLFTKDDYIFTIDKEYSLIDRLIIYVRLLSLLKFLDEVKTLEFKYLVVYSDVQPLEEIIIQYAKLEKIKTISLQHGLYIEYKHLPNINMLNYLEIPSDVFLAWGNHTKKLIEKYNEDVSVQICGKPLVNNNCYRELEEKFITLILDQPLFMKYNELLIDIGTKVAKQLNYKLNVRFHPTDNKENYKLNKLYIDENKNITESQLILGHTSTMMYELLVQGLTVFKLKSDIPSNELPYELTFSSAEELEKIMLIKQDFKKIGLQYIQYIGNESLNKYVEFFDSIEKE